MATSIYQIFKIILGIILAVFILYFALTYSGAYSSIQTGITENQEVRDFIEATNNVYASGNPIDFRFGVGEPFFNYETERFEFNEGFAYPRNTLFFMPGEKLFIDANRLDLGWHEFRYAIAMPETHILVNPLDNSDPTLQYLQSSILMFPSTVYFKPDVVFGFCDGKKIVYDLCEEGWCERDDFAFYLTTPGLAFEQCTAAIPQGYILITTADDCTGKQGICMQAPDSNGIGSVFAEGKEFLYKDPLDITALLVGGEDLYNYKNSRFAEEINFAATAKAERARLLSTAINREIIAGKLDPASDSAKCKDAYTSFANALDDVKANLVAGFYKDAQKSQNLAAALKQARISFGSLKTLGCEQ